MVRNKGAGNIQVVPLQNAAPASYKRLQSANAVCPVAVVPGKSYKLMKIDGCPTMVAQDLIGGSVAYHRFVHLSGPLIGNALPGHIYANIDGFGHIADACVGIIGQKRSRIVTGDFRPGDLTLGLCGIDRREQYLALVDAIQDCQSHDIDAALYRLFLAYHSGEDAPKLPSGNLRKWLSGYASAPRTTKKKIVEFMRKIAWQEGWDVPKTGVSCEIHYGSFPIEGFSRKISKAQSYYLSRAFKQEA